MESEIKNSQTWEKVFVEADKWGNPDIIWIDSTFPKWIPENLRDKRLM